MKLPGTKSQFEFPCNCHVGYEFEEYSISDFFLANMQTRNGKSCAFRTCSQKKLEYVDYAVKSADLFATYVDYSFKFSSVRL